MTGDRSLDDFVEGGDRGATPDAETEGGESGGKVPIDEESEDEEPEDEVPGDETPEEEESGDEDPGDEQPNGDGTETDDGARVEPASSTAAWTTDGTACERCGDVVERRWRDGGRFVCDGCKEW